MAESPHTIGRPRSEDARLAVLHAADDLLVSEGYAAMTMKGIAERAGVGRQTVYRWWSSKAEILLEASAFDSAQELAVTKDSDPRKEIANFLRALARFLTTSDAGLAYRALLGEAQHDTKVAELLSQSDILGNAARPVIASVRQNGRLTTAVSEELRIAELVGPLTYRVLTGNSAPSNAEIDLMTERFLAE